MKKTIIFFSLISLKAMAFSETQFMEMGKCTYTDTQSKQTMSATLLIESDAADSAKAKGLIVFDQVAVRAMVSDFKGLYAETTQVELSDKITVVLGDDNIVDLNKSNKLVFDKNGDASLDGDNGAYKCKMSSDLIAKMKQK